MPAKFHLTHAANLSFFLLASLFGMSALLQDNHFYRFTLFSLNKLTLTFSIGLDRLGLLMCTFILIITAIIYNYAVTYLKSDSKRHTFLFQFLFVVVSSMLLSLSQNLVTAFIAWQFIGISLYLLLNYYHDDPKANQSAKKKFVLNRIGDCTFLTAIVVASHAAGSTAFSALSHAPDSTLIGALLFISVLTKCAQFPFHIWLLDTMEAPTPVSALMHAGIINSGGIILTRVSHLIAENQILLIIIMSSSLLTIALTAHWKKRQPDVKKQLAYSTSAQMGYMIMQCSVGAFPAAILHLITHGFFKASLFLNAGETLLSNQRNEMISSTKQQLEAILFAVIIAVISIYYMHLLNLTLPILIMAFVGITIYSAAKIITTIISNRLTKGFFYGVLAIMLIVYLTLVKLISMYLVDFQLSENMIPTSIQLAGLVAFAGLFYLLNRKKILNNLDYDKTETLFRVYALNPIRAAGEWIALKFKQDGIRKTLKLLIALILITSIAINFNLIIHTKNISNTFIFVLLISNIFLLLGANRADHYKQFIVMIILYQAVFVCYALLHQSAEINKIITYSLINLLPVMLLLLHLVKRQEGRAKHHLTALLLLLIGVPGTASFIAEISLLKVMYQLGWPYLSLYVAGILLLSLSIMHALQLYSFRSEEKSSRKLLPLTHQLPYLFIIGMNIFFGIFPHIILSAV